MLTDDELSEIAEFILEPSPEDVSLMAKELLELRSKTRVEDKDEL